jgi:hypothetical protein
MLDLGLGLNFDLADSLPRFWPASFGRLVRTSQKERALGSFCQGFHRAVNILLNISGRRPSNCVTHGRPLVVYHFFTIKKYLKVS